MALRSDGGDREASRSMITEGSCAFGDSFFLGGVLKSASNLSMVLGLLPLAETELLSPRKLLIALPGVVAPDLVVLLVGLVRLVLVVKVTELLAWLKLGTATLEEV